MADALLNQLQARLRRTLPSAHLQVGPLKGCETLTLALINDDFDTGPLPAETMRAVIAEPAYWAFCWGSGLALAQLLLEQPERVAGRTVLDFGSGCGIAGIAAAMAGAKQVIACDSDPDARLASTTNAALNNVRLTLSTDLASLQRAAEPVDLVLVADVLYDRSNLPLLETLQRLSATLLIADSRITSLTSYGYQVCGERQALTTPNLGEFDEFRSVRFFAQSA